MLLSAVLLAANPPQTATSRIDLRMASCSEEDAPSLRLVDRRNQWFEVIERYEQPLQVLKLSTHRVSDGCLEGPREASVEVQINSYPRDGSKVQIGKTVRIAGEDPKLVDQLDWALLRVTQYGCCGAQDGFRWLDPDSSTIIAISSTEPLPLQLINRESPQGSLWRFAFGLGSVSAAAEHLPELGTDVIAELSFLGTDRAAQRYSVHFKPANEDQDGAWWFTKMAWSGAALEEGNAQTWWIDGPPPTPEQVSGMTLELELHCQCGAAPLTLSIPVNGDKLDVAHIRGNPSVQIKAL